MIRNDILFKNKDVFSTWFKDKSNNNILPKNNQQISSFSHLESATFDTTFDKDTTLNNFEDFLDKARLQIVWNLMNNFNTVNQNKIYSQISSVLEIESSCLIKELNELKLNNKIFNEDKIKKSNNKELKKLFKILLIDYIVNYEDLNACNSNLVKTFVEKY